MYLEIGRCFHCFCQFQFRYTFYQAIVFQLDSMFFIEKKHFHSTT